MTPTYSGFVRMAAARNSSQQATREFRTPSRRMGECWRITEAVHTPAIRTESGSLPLAGDRKPQFFRPGAVPDFSPDGHWIAYSVCGDSGTCQLYVAPYPGPGEQQQVSADGGWDPHWSPDGREILWGGDGGVMAVSVTRAGSTLKLGKPQLLFKTQGGFADVSPDGKRFLIVQDLPTTPATQINVVLNWTENLARATSTSVKP